jgi:hypothetical protein
MYLAPSDSNSTLLTTPGICFPESEVEQSYGSDPVSFHNTSPAMYPDPLADIPSELLEHCVRATTSTAEHT